ncbi:class I SAM-dependent methyltransferase [Roseburia hominis]
MSNKYERNLERVRNLKQSQITYWCHEIIRSQAAREGVYIDATMGNGNDTLLLCELAGKNGEVIAFDIQDQALEATKALLTDQGCLERARLIKDGHEHMDQYVKRCSADVICFNFGYLPGGDHRIATSADTSVTAICKGLDILKNGGMMCLCIYSGGDTGFEEKERILEFIKNLPSREYVVIVNEYYNRGNNPPMPVFIFKK